MVEALGAFFAIHPVSTVYVCAVHIYLFISSIFIVLGVPAVAAAVAVVVAAMEVVEVVAIAACHHLSMLVRQHDALHFHRHLEHSRRC